MARLWQQITKGETGQALPVVLVLLVIGGLLIAPCLSYASTSLNAGQIVEKNVKGVYAADAGVEYALWCLKNSISPPVQPPEENVNQMQVEIDTENKGIYALYFGGLLEVSKNHYDWLAVEGEMIEEAEAYQYTITVTWQPKAGKEGTPTIKLKEVGVRLPVGYSYQPGSAASFLGDVLFSTDEPYDIRQDGADAYMYKWEFDTTVSQDDPIATQTFYVIGEGGQDGDYTWVEAKEQDIGAVGEVTGTLYRITATATSPGDGEPTATVMADATVYETEGETEAEISIILWQINPQ